MRYGKGSDGKVLIIKMEHGDDLLDGIRVACKKEDIGTATVTVIGALSQADLVVGPRTTDLPAEPEWISITDGRELAGTGMIIKGDDGLKVHLHVSLGRGDVTVTGCLRRRARVFVTAEAVVREIMGVDVIRKKDNVLGAETLSFE